MYLEALEDQEGSEDRDGRNEREGRNELLYLGKEADGTEPQW